MTAKNKLNFLLADDHSLIRQGLIFIIEDLEFEANYLQASTLSQIKEILDNNRIDFAILDVHFPDGNSLNVIEELKKSNPEIKILVFSGIDENVTVLKYLDAGINGFVSKLNEESEIANAIKKIFSEGEYLSNKTQKLLLNYLKNPELINPFAQLSKRELEITHLLVEGYGNLEISNQLDIKQNTVSTMKKRIFEKLKIDKVLDLIELYNNHNF